MVAIMHILVGLPCSGKTTLARQIESETGAVRFSPDEWQLFLFGHDMNHPDHDARHTRVEELMRKVAIQLLRQGASVIYDFGFWSVRERDEMRTLARELGVEFRMHYLATPLEEIYRRMDLRNASGRDGIFVFSREDLAQWLPYWQPPLPDEEGCQFVLPGGGA